MKYKGERTQVKPIFFNIRGYFEISVNEIATVHISTSSMARTLMFFLPRIFRTCF